MSLVVLVASIARAPCLGSGLGHDALLVSLVANHNEGESFSVHGRCLLKEVLLPEVEALETRLVGKVEDEEAAVGTSVESEADGSVLLLASSIPHLEGNLLSVHGDRLGLEIGTDGGTGSLSLARVELVDKGSLTYSDIS